MSRLSAETPKVWKHIPGAWAKGQGSERVAVGAFLLRIVAQNEVMNPSRNVHVYVYIEAYKIIFY